MRTIYRLFFSLLLIPLFCSTKPNADNSVLYHQHPGKPFYRVSNQVIIEVDRDDYSKLEAIYKNLQKIIPEPYYVTHETRFVVHIWIYKSLLKHLDNSKIVYQVLNYSNTAFSYYDPTYYQRIFKGFQSLEDLITGYKDNILNEIYLKEIAARYPDLVTYKSLGTTHLKKEIPAIKFSIKSKKHKISILFNGAHHSNELISTEHCYDIIYNLLKYPDKYKEHLEYADIWIVPMVNPDGSEFFWHKPMGYFEVGGRKNGFLHIDDSENTPERGVDINRNYPFKWFSGYHSASSGDDKREMYNYRGPRPASEPETVAMMKLAEEERFLFSISFHSYATCVLFPYTIEQVYNPDPDYVKTLAEKVASVAISHRSDSKKYVAKKNIYPVDGTDQDYYYYKYGTNALLVESSHNNPPYSIARKVTEGFKEAWELVLKEYRDEKKNRLILHITDEEDNPLEAVVSIKEIRYKEQEKHTSNPKTGLFFKMVLEKKLYSIKVEKNGYSTAETKVFPSRDFLPITIRLTRSKLRNKSEDTE